MVKYKKVYLDLKKEIENGTLKANQEMVTENELMERYGYSKDTIRKALFLLESDGYIQKMRGRNSIVLERISNLAEIRTASELNTSNHSNIKNIVHDFHIVQGQQDIMDIFGVDDSVDFYYVSRSREFDGQRVQYEVDYFDRRVVPYLNRKIVETSIYQYLENDQKLKITHSRRQISFRYATEDEKKYMDLDGCDMVAVVTSTSYLSNGQLFQYGTISYRPDKFSFVTMAKR